ncbi:MAG TPA: tyrosine-type recombinase/integrase, partial [Actinomycetota bacterium]
SVGRPCRVHDLRHSHSAMLIREKAHPKAIQVGLGHASIKTTLDTHGHLHEGIDEALAEALDASWRRTTAPGGAA